MIKDKDISIVIQGPILGSSEINGGIEITKSVCLRARKLFPKSEIILSTWEGQNTNLLIYDKLILNKDPGGTPFNYGDHKTLNNCNRLIVSTYAGMRAASSKYIFKIRSDLFIISKSFLEYFYKFKYFDQNCKFVKNRIIAFSIYSLKSERTSSFDMARPYHISDWAYFGHKQDLLNLYNVPLVKEPEFSQWFLTRCKYFNDVYPRRLWKMSPEQYITSTFFNKFKNIKFQHSNDVTNNNVEISEKLIVNNFLVLDQTQFSLISLKHLNLQLLFDYSLRKTAIFYRTWLNDYCKFCKVPKDKQCFKYKIQSVWRLIWYIFFNLALRKIDGKQKRIQKITKFILSKFS